MYKIFNVNDIDREIRYNAPQFVLNCESRYRKQILRCVNHLTKNPHLKFILVAGPSSAGKTTTSCLIRDNLIKKGIKASVVSLDNFFLEREDTPVLPNGKKDYENVNSIDWKLFGEKINDLIVKHQTVLPVYNFITGSKMFDSKPTILNEHDVMIIEGLHALNPIVDNYLPSELAVKVYLNSESEFAYKDTIILNKEEIKLVRRLLRDFKKRGASPEKTFSTWPEVLHGEEIYITPFKKSADFIIDTTHAYEISIYIRMIEKIYKLEENSKDIKLNMLIQKLHKFHRLSHQFVPSTSLLQEFIGGNDN